MPALPQNMDNCYGLGKLQKGWMKCSSQGCEKELDGLFIVSLRTESRIHGHGNLMYMQSIFEGL